MLALPMKEATKADLHGPISQYIKKNFTAEEAKANADAVTDFQRLRDEMAGVRSANDVGRRRIIRYLAQVQRASAKFPDSVQPDSTLGRFFHVPYAFTWADAFKPSKKLTKATWDFESACTLYNLAALETQAGAAADRGSAEGVKVAARSFQLAAGMFMHLRDSVVDKISGAMPTEMSREALDMAANLAQAQAQACYYEKARSTGKPPAICAKLAQQAADLFQAALDNARSVVLSRAIGKDGWAEHFSFQVQCFMAAAHYQAAADAKAKAEAAGEGYGIEVGHLRAAEFHVGSALGMASTGRRGGGTLPTETARSLHEVVARRKHEAEKDNNTIYIERVPAASELPRITGALMAKPLPVPDFARSEDAGPDLFARLVPPEITAAANEFKETQNAAVSALRQEGTAATEAAKQALAAEGLPAAVEAVESSKGLPDSLWAKVAPAQSAGGASHLLRRIECNEGLAKGVAETLDKCESQIASEELADSRYRGQYGAKWRVKPSAEINKPQVENLRRYKGLLAQASGSDAMIRARFESGEESMGVLMRSRAELDAMIPSAASGNAGVAVAERGALKKALAELADLLTAREGLADAAAAAVARCNVVEGLIKNGVEEKGRVFEEATRAAGVGPAVEAARANLAAQEAALKRVMELNGAFTAAMKADDTTRLRQRAIHDVQAAVDLYDSLSADLKQGENFYADLTAHVEQLQQDVSGHAAARQMERDELLEELRAADAEAKRHESDAELARRLAAEPAVAPDVAAQRQAQLKADEEFARKLAEGGATPRDGGAGGAGGAGPAPVAPARAEAVAVPVPVSAAGSSAASSASAPPSYGAVAGPGAGGAHASGGGGAGHPPSLAHAPAAHYAAQAHAAAGSGGGHGAPPGGGYYPANPAAAPPGAPVYMPAYGYAPPPGAGAPPGGGGAPPPAGAGYYYVPPPGAYMAAPPGAYGAPGGWGAPPPGWGAPPPGWGAPPPADGSAGHK